jgi:F0F1-type ATP synthase delta subunit
MRKVTCYETSDGVLYRLRHHAQRHAEDRYGAALTDLAHKAVRVEKYTAMLCFIEENLDAFVALRDLKADTGLEPDISEEE